MAKFKRTMNIQDRRYKKIINGEDCLCMLGFIETREGYEISQTFSTDNSTKGSVRKFKLTQKDEANKIFNCWSLTRVKNGWKRISK